MVFEDSNEIREIAEIDVLAGPGGRFRGRRRRGGGALQGRAKGCRSFALNRSVEHPQRYRLVVGWDNVDDHMVRLPRERGLRRPGAPWSGPTSPNLPRVEHVAAVIDGF